MIRDTQHMCVTSLLQQHTDAFKFNSRRSRSITRNIRKLPVPLKEYRLVSLALTEYAYTALHLTYTLVNTYMYLHIPVTCAANWQLVAFNQPTFNQSNCFLWAGMSHHKHELLTLHVSYNVGIQTKGIRGSSIAKGNCVYSTGLDFVPQVPQNNWCGPIVRDS